jgi:hypothetical protein
MVACGILCRQLKYGASARQVCVRLQGSSTKVAAFRNAELFGSRERRESPLVWNRAHRCVCALGDAAIRCITEGLQQDFYRLSSSDTAPSSIASGTLNMKIMPLDALFAIADGRLSCRGRGPASQQHGVADPAISVRSDLPSFVRI